MMTRPISLNNSYISGLDYRMEQNKQLPQSHSLATTATIERSAAVTASERFLFYSKKTGVVRADAFQDIARPSNHMIGLLGDEPFWLDVTAPTIEEMYMFRNIFQLHPLTVEDILTEDTREKCELYANYYFCCFRTFDPNPQSDYFMQPINVFNIVTSNFILSFHHQSCHHSENVLYRLQRQVLLLTRENSETADPSAPSSTEDDNGADEEQEVFASVIPAWVNYALLDDITDGFAPLLEQLQMEVDSVDELVLVLRQSEQTDMLRRLGEARRRVVAAGRLLNSKPDVIRSLIKRRQGHAEEDVSGDKEEKDDDIDAYLSDILVHFERILGRAHVNYLGQINVELAKSSNRTNDSIAWLTTMGTMLIPMHVITGTITAITKVYS
ncbi:hypothetical protein BDF19DRAFT_434229 [Syncephalis fuscata]|nr:hypothetical protein BDF19DRAFT_434229 [Syncephalis fuscata]